jgi:hypothetical protein
MSEIEEIKSLLTAIENGMKNFKAGTLTYKKKEIIRKNTQELLKNPKINKDQLSILIGLITSFSYGLKADRLAHTLYEAILKDIEGELK